MSQSPLHTQPSRQSESRWRGFVAGNNALNLFRLALAAVLIVSIAIFVAATWNWPLVGDAPLFHYMVSLLRRGQTPYRDFFDVNLPGTYAIQAAVIVLLGQGAHAFRLFDLGLLGIVAAGIYSLCLYDGGGRRKVDAAFPALFAATVFALIHGRDGIIEQGQRDLVLAVLYLSACAFLMPLLQRDASSDASPRRRRLWPCVAGGLLLGISCAIKPSAVLLAAPVLVNLALELRRQRRAWRVPLTVCAAATLVAPILTLIYLVQRHDLIPFWRMLTQLMPYHASLHRLNPLTLIRGSVSSICLPLFFIWLAIFIARRRYTRVLDRLLLIGFFAGIASYILQGRGYPYHRYPSEAFLLVLAAVAFRDVLWPATAEKASSPWVRIAAAAGLSVGVLFLVPRSLQLILRYDPRDEFTADLRSSLKAYGGPALDGRVQCLDDYTGCLNTLQQMHLVQSTGFLNDCYLYTEPTPSHFLDDRERYRQSFAQALLDHPPQIFIVTSYECGSEPDYRYRKLDRWPWLQHYLDTQYRLVEDHIPANPVLWGGKPAPPIGFRIYSRER